MLKINATYLNKTGFPICMMRSIFTNRRELASLAHPVLLEVYGTVGIVVSLILLLVLLVFWPRPMLLLPIFCFFPDRAGSESGQAPAPQNHVTQECEVRQRRSKQLR